MANYDVLALGELLIDFTENAVSGQGNPLFEANPGGAPCNVLAMLNKLGKKTAFMGKVGKDQFGVMLKAVLDELLKHGADIHDFKPPNEEGLSHVSVILRNLEEGRELEPTLRAY